ncbi:hypothetical protein LEN26_013486 [Aphanomyces euteiches]|nr:hypothetical protein LEN26_013486 [Aphanomyces euteiches]KAH9128645.1 hypothetical protein AeMF1_001228 [Aphanomyces euteiches]KAH9192526.1 hypothetical protein AeNC1_005499 [Aphanomyces euteiches]
MIVRAVEDEDAIDTDGSSVRLVWITTTVCAVVLVLLDLSALFAPSSALFGLLPVLLSPSNWLVGDPSLLVNLVVGYLFSSFWIFSRERSTRSACLWIAALAFIGNLALCLYVVCALWDSHSDWSVFWKGRRRQAQAPSSALDRSV